MKIKIFFAVAALLAVSASSAVAQVLPTPVTGTASASASSWIAGGEAGYNWQQAPGSTGSPPTYTARISTARRTRL